MFKHSDSSDDGALASWADAHLEKYGAAARRHVHGVLVDKCDPISLEGACDQQSSRSSAKLESGRCNRVNSAPGELSSECVRLLR